MPKPRRFRPSEPVVTPSGPPLVVYSDGSCESNPGGQGGWGYVVYEASGNTIREKAGYEPRCSTNGMEVRAIVEALRTLDPGQHVTVYTDSRNAISAAKRGKARRLSPAIETSRRIKPTTSPGRWRFTPR